MKAKTPIRNNNRERRILVPMKVDFEITYKNYEKLARFMNDRAKVQGRKRTGLTAKKQKKITQAVKRARHLGLLPFKSHV